MAETNNQNAEDNYIYCDICGQPMVHWHCELLCPNCGYRRDCTDN